MTKREFERRQRLANTLQSLGFTLPEVDALRRISSALQRWYEKECNGEIQRGEDGVAHGYRVNARYLDPKDPRYWYAVPDREKAAEKRLAGIIAARNGRDYHPIIKTPVSYYLQTDPRGAALYILRHGDVPEGKAASTYYTRGICVY